MSETDVQYSRYPDSGVLGELFKKNSDASAQDTSAQRENNRRLGLEQVNLLIGLVNDGIAWEAFPYKIAYRFLRELDGLKNILNNL